MLDYFILNDTAPTKIYTLSLHDALPIYLALVVEQGASGVAPDDRGVGLDQPGEPLARDGALVGGGDGAVDRKSTRLNSSHVEISYAVFCLKKKKISMKHD